MFYILYFFAGLSLLYIISVLEWFMLFRDLLKLPYNEKNEVIRSEAIRKVLPLTPPEVIEQFYCAFGRHELHHTPLPVNWARIGVVQGGSDHLRLLPRSEPGGRATRQQPIAPRHPPFRCPPPARAVSPVP